MPILARALTYATLFVGLLLVFVPSRLLSMAGLSRQGGMGPLQVAGLVLATAGGVTALWCVLVFAGAGRGTPAPFDPPRRLVVRGPYRFVRNPMYIGAVAALAGAALYYRSLYLLIYAGIFLLCTHLFVVLHEEPRLLGTFGPEYAGYSKSVRRWLPGRPPRAEG